MSKKPQTPIGTMINSADLRCAICDAPRGGCDCWTECRCGWLFQKGSKCGNPVHGGKPQPMQAVAFGRLKL